MMLSLEHMTTRVLLRRITLCTRPLLETLLRTLWATRPLYLQFRLVLKLRSGTIPYKFPRRMPVQL